MPGHIFARLGMWPEDIASNEASAKASEEAAREARVARGMRRLYRCLGDQAKAGRPVRTRKGDWVYAIAAGHLRDAGAAQAAQTDAATSFAETRKADQGFLSDVLEDPEGTIAAWTSFASHKDAEALREIRGEPARNA